MMTGNKTLFTIKKILALYILLFSIAFADDNSSIWDITSKSLNSIWQKSKELGSDSWEETKKYTNIGKNILLEETLKTTMNMSLDTNTTEVKEFKINEDDSIKMVLKLVGEKEDLILNIKNYDWGISKDKKYIIFENIQYSANIPWIKYLLDFYLEKNEEYIVVKNSTSKQSLLFSLKSPINTSYHSNIHYSKVYWKKLKKQIAKRWKESDKKDLKYVFSDILDKDEVKISKLTRDKQKLNIHISLKDDNPIKLHVENFDWATANKKKYILLKNIKLDTNRPWIKGMLKNHDNNFYFDYSKPIHKILLSIKSPLKGKK